MGLAPPLQLYLPAYETTTRRRCKGHDASRLSGARLGSTFSYVFLPVNFAPVPNLDDDNDKNIILDFVNDAVVALSDTVLLLIRKFLRTENAWVIGKLVNSSKDTFNIGFWNCPEVFGDGTPKANAIFCHVL